MTQPDQRYVSRAKPSLRQMLMLPAILRREKFTPEQLRIHQERLLLPLVSHAYKNVPYYRELYDREGVSPRDIMSLDDLRKLPIIKSRVFRDQPYEQLLAAGIDPAECYVERSSGTTGRSFPFTYRWDDFFRIVKAMSIRHYRANGVRLRDRILAFSRKEEIWKPHGLHENFGFLRRRVLSCTDSPEHWLQVAAEFKPHVIVGVTNTIREFCRALTDSGERRLPDVRLIITSAERLEAQDRRRFAELLGARTVDVYGAHEGGFHAWECPICCAYHVNSDILIMELLTDGRPTAAGEEGEVVVTALYSDAMPLIRYNLGDIAVASDKPRLCGRPFPLMREFIGREEDYLRFPSGEKLGYIRIYVFLNQQDFVREYKVEQDETGAVQLTIVLEDDSAVTKIPEFEREWRKLLTDSLPTTIQIARRIEPEGRLKRKTITSRYRPTSS